MSTEFNRAFYKEETQKIISEVLRVAAMCEKYAANFDVLVGTADEIPNNTTEFFTATDNASDPTYPDITNEEFHQLRNFCVNFAAVLTPTLKAKLIQKSKRGYASITRR